MTDRTDQLEEGLAHALRALDDLSETVARQDREITRLTARVEMLLQREAAREAEGSGGVIFGDEKPPHY
ncbi:MULTISPECIES: SlyX family protein [Mameliella]|jgi:SlyX protein|uniref:SlyX protein n=1 Tax=Mameliella alba TaxID=561184 RepID=A0A0B3RJW0_9RHOB|nr:MULTISPECIES: SlyX family protein [Mameliella]MBV6638194.1 SlyX family protein [Mameliella sp.]MCR9274248.1 SlyX family protein [Paracoccaceae bacterium]ODM50397.1 SlyX protein [Ruegeria sp. PBVC088]KHQ51530.1 SlyX protein [Mameliella alba]MBY6118090.1 SlyX family protein [Mameliella alba]